MALIERARGITVGSALATRATTDSGRPFIYHEGRPLTYGEVESQAESLAAALANLGVEQNDRIALVLPPCPEFVVSLFAAAKLGAVVVPLDPALTTPELQYLLRHSAAVCAVTIETAHEVDYLQLFEELMPQLPELQYLITVGEEDLWYDDRIFQFEDLLSAGAGRDYPAPELDAATDCFALVYTSGTTGKPKGVELSHQNLLWPAAGTADALGMNESDIAVGVSAFYHAFGLGPGLLGTVLAGASLVLQDGTDADGTLGLLVRHRATVHYGVPTTFVAELRALQARSRDVSSLRICLVSGAPVSDELVRQLERSFCPMVLTAYSLTEASSTVCVATSSDSAEVRRFTVGRAISDTDLRIEDVDGTELPVESVGEIAVRGPGVMLGYFRQPGETAAAIDANGYLRTGDLGMVDEDGFIHLVGRLKEVMIRSGFNVYPREVEFRLEAHPAVQEVAVVGVADPLLGEAICACIVSVEGAIVTEQEIVDWCRETLADAKVPDLVRFLESLPRTGTGKIRRIELSRQMASESSPA
jgi:acyl-CoA synthetase (AMP-forming)/AMP-acid ligase II